MFKNASFESKMSKMSETKNMLIRDLWLFCNTFQHLLTFICDTLQNGQFSGTQTDRFRVLRQSFCGKFQMVCGPQLFKCMESVLFAGIPQLPGKYQLIAQLDDLCCSHLYFCVLCYLACEMIKYSTAMCQVSIYRTRV